MKGQWHNLKATNTLLFWVLFQRIEEVLLVCNFLVTLYVIVGKLNSKAVNALIFLQKLLYLAFCLNCLLNLWKQDAELGIRGNFFVFFQVYDFFFRLEEILGYLFHSTKDSAFGPLRPISEQKYQYKLISGFLGSLVRFHQCLYRNTLFTTFELFPFPI